MKMEVCNEFHSTVTEIEVPHTYKDADGFPCIILPQRDYARACKKLCGMFDCCCCGISYAQDEHGKQYRVDCE